MIAVPSLTPTYGLLCLQPVDGYAAGTIRPVYGGNLNEGSVYTNGVIPKDWRSTVDSGEYEAEVRLQPLPDTLEELNPADYPGCYQLVITDAKVIPLPVPEVASPKRICKVRQHPATFELLQNTPAKTKAAKVLPLFPDYPTKQTA